MHSGLVQVLAKGPRAAGALSGRSEMAPAGATAVCVDFGLCTFSAGRAAEGVIVSEIQVVVEAVSMISSSPPSISTVVSDVVMSESSARPWMWVPPQGMLVSPSGSSQTQVRRAERAGSSRSIRTAPPALIHCASWALTRPATAEGFSSEAGANPLRRRDFPMR
jgi:hypothetical protein